jgi:hypothetical protein
MTNLSDEVLRSFCSSNARWEYRSVVQTIQDYIRDSLAEGPLTNILHQQPLNDRFPIFGREGNFVSRDFVEYNDPRKRVTVPTFDIVAAPAVPSKYFRLCAVKDLRRIFEESVAAIQKCQIGYFYNLVQACGQYNEFYPLTSISGELTKDFLCKVHFLMQDVGVTPAAVLINEKDYNDKVAMAVWNFGLGLITVNSDDRAYYVFGQANDPKLTTGHIVDNRTKLEFNWDQLLSERVMEDRIQISLRHNCGFLTIKPGVLRIDRVWEKGKPKADKKKPETDRRIQAFVVGEEGGEIISIVD